MKGGRRVKIGRGHDGTRFATVPTRTCRSAEDYLDCFKNYSVLEQAVLETADNQFNIIRSFYSPDSASPSFYVKVKYVNYQ